MEDGISGRRGMKKTGHRINPRQTQKFKIPEYLNSQLLVKNTFSRFIIVDKLVKSQK